MASTLTNVSFDGSPVQFRLDSPLLACFDPLALDMICESLQPDGHLDVGALLERVAVSFAAMSCYTVEDFQPGFYKLDPRDIQKFGDEEHDFDFSEGEHAETEPVDKSTSFPFVAVDSGALIIADVAHLPKLVTLLTWEQYDLGLQDDAVFVKIIEALGGPYFAVIYGGCMPGMEFDGDGTYTIPPGCVRPNGR
jgi:hypothetical protein